MTDTDILELLVESRDRNQRLEITGMLLYIDGTFLQVLEGPEAAVKEVFESIKVDPRHQQAITLAEEEVSGRDFPNWSMGFEPVENYTGPQAEEMSNFLKTPWSELDLESYSEAAQLFLKTFRDLTRGGM